MCSLRATKHFSLQQYCLRSATDYRSLYQLQILSKRHHLATPMDDYWYTADGVEIGSVIWGAYARILQVENDPCADLEGVQYNALAPTGFGYYK